MTNEDRIKELESQLEEAMKPRIYKGHGWFAGYDYIDDIFPDDPNDHPDVAEYKRVERRAERMRGQRDSARKNFDDAMDLLDRMALALLRSDESDCDELDGYKSLTSRLKGKLT